MRAALRIARKDLSQRIRDRSAILLGLVAPLGLALIFSLIIPDTSGGNFHVSVGVVNADGGAISQGFVTEVLPAVADAGVLDYTDYPDEAAATAAVDSGSLDAAYLFPAGLTDSVQRGAGGTIRMVGNVDQTIATQIARSVLESYTAEVDAVTIAVGAAMTTGATDAAALSAAASQVPAAVVLTDVAATSKQLDVTTFFSAGMAVFFLFFTVQFGVSSLLEERFLGTLQRLLAAPIGRWSVLAGKGIASFVLGMVSMVVLAVATSLLIGADWGNPFGVAVLMVCGVLSALGIMAVVAVISRTPEQAANWQSIVAVVLGLLGGTFFPLSQGPKFLGALSKLTPHSWFLSGLGDLSSGSGVSAVVEPALAMLAFFVVTLGAAMLFGKKVLTS